MHSDRELGRLAVTILVVLASAALWTASGVANAYLLSFGSFAPGIDFVYLPAGLRLLIVLLFGVWGALGIALANPVLYMLHFGSGSALEIIVNSLICGFAPFLTVKVFCRTVGIQASLLELKPIHLPLLALAVSIVTPLTLNLNFLATGLKQPGDVTVNVAAMSAGDFLGCLLVIVLVQLSIAAFRTLSPQK